LFETGGATLNKILVMNGGSFSNASGINTFSGATTLSNLNTFNIAATSQLTMSTALNGPGALTKTGAGTLSLSANNGYTGATVVNAGKIILSGAGAIASSPSIEVDAGATFDPSALGTFTLTSGRTLLGNGTVNGNNSINCFLSPGLSVGRLTFNNALTLAGTNLMELNKTGVTLTNDSISVGGTLFCGGALVVTNIGNPLAAGDIFKLFATTSFSGSFASMTLPPLNAGLRWNTDQLLVTGTIQVDLVSPQILSPSQGGTNLLVNVQSELGRTYVLQTTTKLEPPLLWTNLSTNAGNGSVLTLQLPIIGDEPQRVFRFLVY
jgi:autotransporter-associated beta strand protein